MFRVRYSYPIIQTIKKLFVCNKILRPSTCSLKKN